MYLAFKFRCVDFYKYANPGFKNGGLFDDSKYDIYQLIPTKLYPKTVLVKPHENQIVEGLLAKNNLSFPLIVKPDIGLRGIGVEKVHTVEELMQYAFKTHVPFLIQENINYPNEMGLFYCRLPNQLTGTITGITHKKFLSLEGNGKDTIKDLLQKNPRYAMQIHKLSHQLNLEEILPNKQKKCLVPFGNHNRGTEFLNGKEMISESLHKTLDAFLKNIPGFYYGRLDIRYNTIAELEQGQNFSIIEINGAKSEPTHIYDPKHSLWYAQKEIFKHQKWMRKIIELNLKRDELVFSNSSLNNEREL
jgi:hypothetical protein